MRRAITKTPEETTFNKKATHRDAKKKGSGSRQGGAVGLGVNA